jgi:hypothetical protein
MKYKIINWNKKEIELEEIPQNVQEIPAKKLDWGKTADKEMTWQEAKEWCESQGEGWRMPTRVELIEACDNKIEGFKSDSYWSSTTYASYTSSAWFVNLSISFVSYSAKATSYYVRCVRQY